MSGGTEGNRKLDPIVTPPNPYATWGVLRQADTIVGVEALALAALHSLTTPQLRAIVWIGLLDEGWSRVFDELDSRGETL